ncbi:MAG: hypothetical protein KME26_19125 [Oscillatoria princeps RMCB-10]|nr:hypothetical protein [Oscillatoria princeps RMCB-10]
MSRFDFLEQEKARLEAMAGTSGAGAVSAGYLTKCQVCVIGSAGSTVPAFPMKLLANL